MHLDRETLELLEELRKQLDLVEAYWYFVEHGADAHDCGLARKTLAKFEGTAAPSVVVLIDKLQRKLDGRDRS
jgi:hypothetical protein